MAVKEMSIDGTKGIMNNDSISGRPSHIGRRNRKAVRRRYSTEEQGRSKHEKRFQEHFQNVFVQ